MTNRMLRLRENLLVLVLGALAIGGLVLLDSIGSGIARDQATEEIAQRLKGMVRTRAALLNNRTTLLTREVLFLSATPPVDALAEIGPLGSAETTERKEWRNRLTRIFQAYATTNPEILQLRLIGVEDGGREIVRVDRVGHGIAVVPDSAMQRKGDRDYFLSTLPLPQGRIHVSALDLNIEHGRIQIPIVPTLRAATPVYGHDRSPYGILVVNLDANLMLREFRASTPPLYSLYLTNAASDFLSHPSRDKEFGSFLGKPWKWMDEFGSGAPLDSVVHITTRDGSKLLMFSQSLAYDPQNPNNRWVVCASFPDSVIQSRVTRIRVAVSGISIGVVLLSTLLFYLHLLGLRRRVQAQESQARLGAIVGSAGDAIVGLTLDGVVTSWNHAARTMFGIEEIDALARPFGELVRFATEGEKKTALSGILAKVAEGELVTGEVLHLERPDPMNPGQLLVSLSGSPVRQEGQLVDALALTMRDITEQERTKERIIALNENLEAQVAERTARIEEVSILQRAILKHAGWAIIATDPDGLIQLFNPAAEALLGWTSEELVGKFSPSLFHSSEEVSKRVAQLREQEGLETDGFRVYVAVADRDGSETREWAWIRKDGSRVPVLLAVSPLRDSNDRPLGYLGIAQDLTERHRFEDELRRRSEEAIAAGRAKSEFLANMSHEIRTPLNGVLGLASVLERRELDPSSKDLVRKIRRSGGLLRAIIDDILDMSKIEAGRLDLDASPFQLDDVLDNLGTIMGSNAGDKELELVIGPVPREASHLLGDSHRLEQILVNLTGNAIKFTQTGSVTVGIRHAGTSHGIATLEFTVADTGIGIPADRIPLLFQTFAQADSSMTRKYGGTGLGLAISRMLVEKMGGGIEVESEPGKGSVFRFSVRFPVILPPPPDGSLRRLEVLVADDSPPARDALAAIIESIGWSVDAQDSGFGAVSTVIERQGGGRPFDVLLLDWKMPDLDGLAVAKLVREMSFMATPPVILLATAYSLQELEDLPERDFVDGVLSKPVTSSSLHDAVIRVVLGRTAPRTITYRIGHRLEGLRILVVDDNEVNRDVAQALCRQEGAVVVLAEDGREALRALEADPLPDVILMDVQMPVMDGYQATRTIRETPRLSTIPVIALSAGVLHEERQAARTAGMDAFIAKPFEAEDFFTTIDAVVRLGAAPVSTNSASKTHELLELGPCLALWKSPDAVKDRLVKFADKYGGSVAEVDQRLSANDIEQAAFLVHRLRGAAGALGLALFSECCAQLEIALRKGLPWEDARDAFADTLDATLRAIEEWDPSISPTGGASGDPDKGKA